MRIDEVGAAICAPNDRGGREALESFISSGVPGTLHRGVRPEIYAHFERENVRAVLVSSIQKHSHEGISDAERAKTKAELELRLDAKERDEENAIREIEALGLTEDRRPNATAANV
jgi:hypothetical protein